MYPHEKESSKGVHVLLIKNILDRDHNLSQVVRCPSTRATMGQIHRAKKNQEGKEQKIRGAWSVSV